MTPTGRLASVGVFALPLPPGLFGSTSKARTLGRGLPGRRLVDDRGLGTGVTVVGARADREPARDLVSHLVGTFGDRCRNDRAIDHRRGGRLRRAWHRRVMDQVSV